MLKSKRRKVLAIVALAGLIFWLGASALVAWKFTRRDRPPFPEPPPQVAWANVEGHRLETSDGQQLGAWLVRGDRQKGCVLLLHGNGSLRGEMLPVMQWLAEAHFTALAISLRAHGDSSGQTNDIGWSARHDVAAAVAFLERECPGQPVYIVGRSLGAAAAIFAADDLKEHVAGYFLEQPYKDLKSATWNRLQHYLPPVLDWIAYGGLRLWAPVFLSVDPEQVSPCDHLQDIPNTVPVVFITGSADRHAHLADVKCMCRQIESHAQLVVFSGAAHEALDRYDPKLYRATLFRFLNQKRRRPPHVDNMRGYEGQVEQVGTGEEANAASHEEEEGRHAEPHQQGEHESRIAVDQVDGVGRLAQDRHPVEPQDAVEHRQHGQAHPGMAHAGDRLGADRVEHVGGDG